MAGPGDSKRIWGISGVVVKMEYFAQGTYVCALKCTPAIPLHQFACTTDHATFKSNASQ